MKTLYLHMGAPKTGTSVLQSAFALNTEQLAHHDILYPDNGFNKSARNSNITSGNGFYLALGLMPSCEITDPIINSLENHVKNILEYLSTITDKSVMYSSEFFEFFLPEKMNKFINAVKEMGFKIIFIYYVRHFSDYLYSLYCQHIKHNRVKNDIDSFEAWLQQDSVHALLFDCITKLSAFPKENIILKSYDAVKNNLIEDFMKNVLHTPINIIFPKRNIINANLTYHEMAFLRIFHQHCTDTETLNLLCESLVENRKDSTKFISEDAASLIKDRFQNHLTCINQFLDENNKIALFGDIPIKNEKIKNVIDIDFANKVKSMLNKYGNNLKPSIKPLTKLLNKHIEKTMNTSGDFEKTILERAANWLKQTQRFLSNRKAK